MQNLLVRCSAVAVIIGGFMFTGDLARLAERGTRLLNARTIPSDDPQVPAAEPPAEPPVGGQALAEAPADRHAAASPRLQPAGQQESPHDAPLGRPADAPPPPDGGVASVQLAALQPGDRLFVWLSRPASALADGNGRTVMIAFDIVDPASGEALEQRHVAACGGRRPATVLGSPRRVVIAGSGVPGLFDDGLPSAITPGRIAKGETIVFAQQIAFHGAGRAASPEAFGPVLAVQVTRPYGAEVAHARAAAP